MEHVLASRRFLAATAACCGLAVALAMWAAGDAGGGARALAGLVGLAASLAVMILVAWAASDEPRVAPAAPAVAAPDAPTPPPRVREGHDVLAKRLDEGRGLRTQLGPGSTDPRVASWIDDARTAIEAWRPGVVGYFDALAQRTYADDGLRLDAYTRRLETIVRDF